MKDKIKAMLDAKNAKLEELRAANEAAQTVEELRSIEQQITTVTEERNSLQEMYDNFDMPANTGNHGLEVRNTMNTTETRDNAATGREERANKFAASNAMTISNEETRAALLVSGGSIAQPTGVSGINGLFPQVSSIVDMVKIVDASNMGGGYTIAYQITDSTAADHTEGSAASESEPTFDTLTINAKDKALVSYISNKVREQSPLTYEMKVRESAMTALRKEASKMIIDALKASTIADTVDVTVTGGKGVLDAGFLRRITLSYGGDESIGGSAVLILNKADLIALGDIRGTNEKEAVFDITPDAMNPNTGIIKDGGLSVRYVINNNCQALSGTAQTTNAVKGIFYGNPQYIELAMFSDFSVKTSEDYKFAEDMMTVRGKASMGVGMGVYKGFVVAQIPASA